MRRFPYLPIITIAILFNAAACGRSAGMQVPSGDVGPPIPTDGSAIPAGTLLTARLNEPLGPKTRKFGEPFTAATTAALVAQNGQTVVPSGATLYGHITVMRAPDTGDEGVISLAFDSLALANRRYLFFGSISSVTLPGAAASPVAPPKTGMPATPPLGTVLSFSEHQRLLNRGTIVSTPGTPISLGQTADPALPAGTVLTVRSTLTIDLR